MSDAQQAPAANTYDAVPYRDHPYCFTHPRHLETMAVLFGMEPPPITKCRVLELGCAGGGNVIPLAVDLPASTFLGIDLSQRQIEQGSQIVETLGLKNIELRCANIMDVDAGWGQFDYIVSHGIFSWVPPAVQDKLLEISARNLSPQGVAFVSYNTYPGWHLGKIVRDLMCYHASQFDQPADKIAQAKAVLEFMAGLSSEKQAAGLFLKEELEMLRRINNDSYLFHDHLETNNEPVYFYQFMERAEAKGLQYLAEADFSTMLLRNLPQKTHEPFSKLPIIRQEQYMDFVRGRRFRKTMLCHRGIGLQRHVTQEKMKQFHFALAGLFDPVAVDIRNDSRVDFALGGSRLTVGNRLVKAAIMYLKEVHPRCVSFPHLYATAVARIGQSRPLRPNDPDTAPDVLAVNLLAGYTIDMFGICVHPPCCAARANDRPVASPLARLQAAHSGVVTNQFHKSVTLDSFGRRLIRRLDGTHDRAALTGCAIEAIAEGELTVKRGGQVLKQPDPKTLSEIIDGVLSQLTRSALLVN